MAALGGPALTRGPAGDGQPLEVFGPAAEILAGREGLLSALGAQAGATREVAIGAATYDPADLVEWTRIAAGCSGWVPVGLYFDASAALPPIPSSVNVTGADERNGMPVMTFDVPATLKAPAALPDRACRGRRSSSLLATRPIGLGRELR